MNAYIVNDGEVICSVDTELKNGTEVLYSENLSKEALNASRDFNLVNASTGKISRAKKYDKYFLGSEAYFYIKATEINPGEFYLENIGGDE